VHKLFLYLLLVFSLLSSSCTKAPADPQNVVSRKDGWTYIDQSILISTGELHENNIALITSGTDAILIDTGSGGSESERVKTYLEENALSLRYIIATHPDKASQIKHFKTKDTKVILPTPSRDGETLTLGEHSLTLLYTPGYPGDNCLSILVNEDILFAGDLLTSSETFPKVLTHLNVVAAIDSLEKLSASIIVPAHGPVIEDKAFIANQLTALKDLQQQSKVVVEDGLIFVEDDIIVSQGDYEKVNMTLVISGNEGVLIDTGCDAPEAKIMKAYMARNNITLKQIIITHEHSDHIANLSAFVIEPVSVFTFENMTQDVHELTLGDKQLQIFATPGHFNDQHLSVTINERILVAGDILATNIKPTVLLSYGGTRDTLYQTLEQLTRNKYDFIIPGHGDICYGQTILLQHLGALE
jgi:glyoxylase-like metal-dependent hydrolase (beta-lactamase superfamily II)